ncbi:MAG: hypothetical protein ACLQF0_11510 [Dissulfurispiraceae bacterium]
MSAKLCFLKDDIALMGVCLDDRGEAAKKFLHDRADDIYALEYNVDDFTLSVNGSVINAENIDDFLHPFIGKSIVLETTTLGFVEIFLCCRALKNLGIPKFDLIYVEPHGYNSPRRTASLLNKRDFELSGEVPGYRAIPGAAIMLTDRQPQLGVFFLGYEERRLEQALEDYQMIQTSRCCSVFGVPAFKPGWEMDAFANNIRVIRDKNVRGGIKFCGAENPAAAVSLLTDIYKGLEPNEKMFIAPLGTKPHGIGVALFASVHKDVGILYDHPRRRHGRSSDVSRWHLYTVEF